MAIPAVIQGTIEVEGKVFELDSPKGWVWVETIDSFRFEPSSGHKAYTVRREASGYWYGCRKVAGKVRKKYIGKTSEISRAKLEEIAKALEVPPVARISKVAEVAQSVQVTERVAEVAQDRLTALELEVANLRKAFEALQEALPGKAEAGNSKELPKVNSEVAEKLQNELSNLKAEELSNLKAEELSNLKAEELSNLKAENETLRQKLAESKGTIGVLNWGTEGLNEQLEAVRVENQRLQNDLGNSQAEVTELRSQLEQERADREEVEAQLADRGEQLRQLVSELTELKQKSAAASKDLPEAADLLNQLKAKRKKSKTDLADLEVILEILES
jgi:chromosome segregation ATPase